MGSTKTGGGIGDSDVDVGRAFTSPLTIRCANAGPRLKCSIIAEEKTIKIKNDKNVFDRYRF